MGWDLSNWIAERGCSAQPEDGKRVSSHFITARGWYSRSVWPCSSSRRMSFRADNARSDHKASANELQYSFLICYDSDWKVDWSSPKACCTSGSFMNWSTIEESSVALLL